MVWIVALCGPAVLRAQAGQWQKVESTESGWDYKYIFNGSEFTAASGDYSTQSTTLTLNPSGNSVGVAWYGVNLYDISANIAGIAPVNLLQHFGYSTSKFLIRVNGCESPGDNGLFEAMLRNLSTTQPDLWPGLDVINGSTPGWSGSSELTTVLNYVPQTSSASQFISDSSGTGVLVDYSAGSAAVWLRGKTSTATIDNVEIKLAVRSSQRGVSFIYPADFYTWYPGTKQRIT